MRWAGVNAGGGAAVLVAVLGRATVFGGAGLALDDRTGGGDVVAGLAVTVTCDVTGDRVGSNEVGGDEVGGDEAGAEDPVHAVSPTMIASAATAAAVTVRPLPWTTALSPA
jgi:hypothetical protein